MWISSNNIVNRDARFLSFESKRDFERSCGCEELFRNTRSNI